MNELFDPSFFNWMLIIFAAFIIGLSKAGIKGIDMMNVTLMALVFGSKVSTGVVLPLLCVADGLAVVYYHRHARWEHFRRLLPWIVVGIFIGLFIGKEVNEAVFRKIMAAIILLTVVIVLLLEWRKPVSLPRSRSFATATGLAAGFTTMLGNLAGTIANVYFLAMRLPKNDFIGTAAWLFLVINLFKVPLQAFYWQNITAATLSINLLLLPAVVAGFFLGIRLVARIRDIHYRRVVIVLTIVGALIIFFRQ